MATIMDVARLAEVSVATVSRVLNGVSVTEANRNSVLAAIKQLDYRPNAFARSLATNRSGGLGVVVNEVSSPFYGGVVNGIESELQAHGKHLIVSSGHADRRREREAVDFLLHRRTDALILHLEATSDDDLLQLSKQRTPIVIVGRHVVELTGNCIYLDNFKGGQLATKHLIDRGHRRIAHITGNLSIKDARDRLDGYRRALSEAGIRYDEALVVEGDFVEGGGQRAMERLLDRELGFTAVFCANDQTAAGALVTLRERGKNVPSDISVVGYDDVLLANYLHPALTTIRQPFAEMGQAAARLALKALGANAEGEVTRRFEPTLIERGSVSTLST